MLLIIVKFSNVIKTESKNECMEKRYFLYNPTILADKVEANIPLYQRLNLKSITRFRFRNGRNDIYHLFTVNESNFIVQIFLRFRLEALWKDEVKSKGENKASFLRCWLKFCQTRILVSLVIVAVNALSTFLVSVCIFFITISNGLQTKFKNLVTNKILI